MRAMLRWSFVVWMVLALAGCAPDDESVGRRADSIVRGEIDEGDPAVVSVGGFCTGTLISPKIVLTARHCLNGGSTPGYSIYFGTYDGAPGGTTIAAVHQQRYPSSSGDIAVITLAEAGPAEPIPVNHRDLAPHIGETVRIVGFGVTSESGGGGGVKRWGTSSLLSVNAGEMFNSNDVSGTCYGDSGGPNFMTFDGVEVVAGVTSYGTSVCGAGQDVAARTDTYYDWIMEYVNARDPASCEMDQRCAQGCMGVDPDCPCAEDGLCTAACTDVASDPDCAGCEADGTCRMDCPVLDTDCCGADGACLDACGELDPDCDDGGGSGSGGSGGGGSGGGGSGESGGVSGGCAVGGVAGGPVWLVLLGLAGLLGRRRRGGRRGGSQCRSSSFS